MGSITVNENDLHTVSGVKTYLLDTPFASNTVTQLSGGFTNFTFRLHLKTPYEGHVTLVLKHAKPYVAGAESMMFSADRQTFEVEALKRVRASMPGDMLVTVPAVHHFDETVNVVIMDDCGEGSVTLKEFMLTTPPNISLANTIGSELGRFLGWLHTWGKGNDAVLNFFHNNPESRTISAFVTYGRLVSTISGEDELPALADPLLDVAQDKLDTISRLASERTRAMCSTMETLTMGDFWPGNMMVNVCTEKDGTGARLESIHVLDWEVTKPGLPGLDVGQFCAEIHLVRRFKPSSAEAASATLAAFLNSYKSTYNVDTTLSRIAVSHLGAHLITWPPRVDWGGKELTREVVEEGIEQLVKGYSGAEEELKGSILGSLFD